MERQDEVIRRFSFIHDLENWCLKIATVRAALTLDIFSFFAEGPQDLSDYVRVTGHDHRGSRVLLEALAALELLEVSANGYSLTPAAESFFLPSSPLYYGRTCMEITLSFPAAEGLALAVRTGQPAGLDSRVTGEGALWASDFAPWVALWPDKAEAARKMWRALGVNREALSGPYILDVGCGAGIKAFVLLQGDPEARCRSLDLHPEVLEVARRLAEAMGVAERVSYEEADLLNADLGVSRYDLIHVGSVLYFFSPSQLSGFFRRACRALRPRGRLVINHMLVSEASTPAPVAALLAVQLLLFHPTSEVHSFTTYCRLLEKAGFQDVALVHIADACANSEPVVVTAAAPAGAGPDTGGTPWSSTRSS